MVFEEEGKSGDGGRRRYGRYVRRYTVVLRTVSHVLFELMRFVGPQCSRCRWLPSRHTVAELSSYTVYQRLEILLFYRIVSIPEEVWRNGGVYRRLENDLSRQQRREWSILEVFINFSCF